MSESQKPSVTDSTSLSSLSESQQTEDDIRSAAHRLIVEYRWQSISENQLIERVQEWAATVDRTGPYWLKRLCERAAAAQLYAACERGVLRTVTVEERERLEQAYQDLGNWLYAVTARMPSSPAPGESLTAVVQNTLIEIHKHFASCTDPSSFLGFAATILERQRLATWRNLAHQNQREVSIDRILHSDDESESDNSIRESKALVFNDSYDGISGERMLFALFRDELNSNERLLALCFMVGLKRRDVLLLFSDSMTSAKYDNLRRSLIYKLRKSARFRQIYNLPEEKAQ